MLEDERAKSEKLSTINTRLREALVSNYQEFLKDLPHPISQKKQPISTGFINLAIVPDLGGESQQATCGQSSDADGGTVIARETLKERFEKKRNPRMPILLEQLFKQERLDTDSGATSLPDESSTESEKDHTSSISKAAPKPIRKQLLYGQAGIGKSILCRYIAWQWADRLTQVQPDGIAQNYEWVFHLSLKRLYNFLIEHPNGARPENIIANFVVESCLRTKTARQTLGTTEDAVKTALTTLVATDSNRTQSDVLWLLDGYDEIASWDNDEQFKRVLDLLFDMPNMLVTSRRLQGEIDHQFDRELELTGLDDLQAETFINRHCSEDNPGALLKTLRGDLGLWGCAHVPFLLSIICHIWSVDTGTNISHNWSDGIIGLYQRLIGLFLERQFIDKAGNDSLKTFPHETRLEKIRDELYKNEYNLLRQLAFDAICENQAMLTSTLIKKSVNNCLREDRSHKFKRLVDSSGLLVPLKESDASSGYVACEFVHLTVQEYLAAEHLLVQLADRALAPNAVSLITSKRYDANWVWVIQFLAELVARQTQGPALQCFWQALLDEPFDMVGTGQLEATCRALEPLLKDETIRDKIFKAWSPMMPGWLIDFRLSPLLLSLPRMNHLFSEALWLNIELAEEETSSQLKLYTFLRFWAEWDITCLNRSRLELLMERHHNICNCHYSNTCVISDALQRVSPQDLMGITGGFFESQLKQLPTQVDTYSPLIKQLKALGSRIASPSLIDALIAADRDADYKENQNNDNYTNYRWNIDKDLALQALSSIVAGVKDSNIVLHLLKKLSHLDFRVRMAVLQALTEVHDKALPKDVSSTLIERCLKMLNEDHPGLQLTLVALLVKITCAQDSFADEAAATVMALVSTNKPDINPQFKMLEMLCQFPTNSHHQRLLALMSEPSWQHIKSQQIQLCSLLLEKNKDVLRDDITAKVKSLLNHPIRENPQSILIALSRHQEFAEYAELPFTELLENLNTWSLHFNEETLKALATFAKTETCLAVIEDSISTIIKKNNIQHFKQWIPKVLKALPSHTCIQAALEEHMLERPPDKVMSEVLACCINPLTESTQMQLLVHITSPEVIAWDWLPIVARLWQQLSPALKNAVKTKITQQGLSYKPRLLTMNACAAIAGQTNEPFAVEALMQGLRDVCVDIRIAAIRGLEQSCNTMLPSNRVSELIEATHDPESKEVIIYALSALLQRLTTKQITQLPPDQSTRFFAKIMACFYGGGYYYSNGDTSLVKQHLPIFVQRALAGSYNKKLWETLLLPLAVNRCVGIHKLNVEYSLGKALRQIDDAHLQSIFEFLVDAMANTENKNAKEVVEVLREIGKIRLTATIVRPLLQQMVAESENSTCINYTRSFQDWARNPVFQQTFITVFCEYANAEKLDPKIPAVFEALVQYQVALFMHSHEVLVWNNNKLYIHTSKVVSSYPMSLGAYDLFKKCYLGQFSRPNRDREAIDSLAGALKPLRDIVLRSKPCINYPRKEISSKSIEPNTRTVVHINHVSSMNLSSHASGSTGAANVSNSKITGLSMNIAQAGFSDAFDKTDASLPNPSISLVSELTKPSTGDSRMKIIADNRPSDYEYAVLSNHVYGDKALKKGNVVPIETPQGTQYWKVRTTHSGANNYFGALYFNQVTHHFVVAHKGTDSFLSLVEDAHGVYFNGISPQKEEAYKLTEQAIEDARNNGGKLSFTGHSLGAYLAELSLFYCYISFEPAAGEIDIRELAHAVTFESPGSAEIIQKMQSNNPDKQINVGQLDITAYLSYPNLVNTCNRHIGTIYSLVPNVGSWANVPGWHTYQVHTMISIVKEFEKNPEKEPARQYMLDWPLGNQRSQYFKYVELTSGQYIWSSEEQTILNLFDIALTGHLRVDHRMSVNTIMPLRHFGSTMRDWLQQFYGTINVCLKNEAMTAQLHAKWQDLGVPEEELGLLMLCTLMKNGQSYRDEAYIEYCATESSKLTTLSQVRRKLTTWLSGNQEIAAKLLVATVELRQVPDIEAVLLKSGAKLTSTGVISNPEVRGVYAYIPKDTSKDMLEHFERVSNHLLSTLKNLGIKVSASLAAPGAIIEGRIENPVVRAVEFRVGSAPRADLPDRVQEVVLANPPTKPAAVSQLHQHGIFTAPPESLKKSQKKEDSAKKPSNLQRKLS